MLKLVKIKQLFPDRGLESPRQHILSLLQSEKFNAAISGRKRIAVAVGSRGISNIAVLVGEVVSFLKGLGVEPVIIPAMGSHGHATADGQKMVLSKLGITEESVGAEIASSMEIIKIGSVEMDGRGFPVYVDRMAWEETDGIIFINRVKTHTNFVSKYESGLVKMSSVGLGKQKGAEQIHSLGIRGLKELMPAMAEVVLASDKVIGGFAITEDAYHQTADIGWLNRDEILEKEPGILDESKKMIPHFPIDDFDLLVIKQMGKDISGVGIDPKVIGRLMVYGEEELPSPNMELMAVCDLTDASCSNAIGVGLADFTTRCLFKKIDFDAMRANLLTSTFYLRGKIPLVLDDEKQIMEVCLKHFQRRGIEDPKVIIIKDTLSLSYIYVSESIAADLKNAENIDIISEPAEIVFDGNNEIVTDF